MAISDWEMAKKVKVHLDRELHETAKRAWLEETYARSGNYQIGPDVLERLENAKRQAELRNLREAQWGKPTPENINDIGIFTMDIDGVAALWKPSTAAGGCVNKTSARMTTKTRRSC